METFKRFLAKKNKNSASNLDNDSKQQSLNSLSSSKKNIIPDRFSQQIKKLDEVIFNLSTDN